MTKHAGTFLEAPSLYDLESRQFHWITGDVSIRALGTKFTNQRCHGHLVEGVHAPFSEGANSRNKSIGMCHGQLGNR